MARQIVATVGRFSWDGQAVTGPRAYMEDPQGWGKAKASLESGSNVLIGAAPIGTSPITLMLVAVQTDYAGWCGHKEMETWL